ncbi:MAG: hypothetical protein JXB60_04040, partial [Candidatus Cloacimonetes bacterium]|nr:hypothetical protein [Candidatus Cloacimonadota bacterium]
IVMLVAVINVMSVNPTLNNSKYGVVIEKPEGNVVCEWVKVERENLPNLDNNDNVRYIRVCKPVLRVNGNVPDRGFLQPVVESIKVFLNNIGIR